MNELHSKKQMLSGHVVYAEGQRTTEGRWEVFIKENGEELAFIKSEKGKWFVMRMVRNAIIGCLSHIGKRGRMAANKAKKRGEVGENGESVEKEVVA